MRSLLGGSHITCDYAVLLALPPQGRLSSFGAAFLRLRKGAPTSLAALRLDVFACGAALVQLLSITPISALRALGQLRAKKTTYFIFSTNIIQFSINNNVYTVLLRCFKKKGVFLIKIHFVCL
jgi:hypothetical protein